MSGGNNRRFTHDPKGFIRNSVLEISWGQLNTPDVPEVKDFDIVSLQDTPTGVRRYRLEDYTRDSFGQNKVHGQSSRRIRAFWLPFQPNDYREIHLSDAADFFFTATLTGCTLAIGSGHDPRVAHINYQANVGGNATVIDQDQIDQDYFQHYRFDMNSRTVQKDDYWDPAANQAQYFTVVGVRRAEGWKLYLNGRQRTADGFSTDFLYGCRKV